MARKFKTVVLGATALGCGIAYAGGDSVVLIDEGADLAVDYTRTLRPMSAVSAGGVVAQELISRGLVKHGVSTPALDAIMCGLLKNVRAGLLLCCRPTTVERENSAFSVGYFGANGFGRVVCDRVIDTRAHVGEKRFNLICARISGDGALSCDGFEVFPGGFDSEGFLSMKLAPDVTSPRIEALSRFECGLSRLSPGWKIAAAAHETDVRGQIGMTESDGIIAIQSAAYENADIAFEEGRRCFMAVS